MNIDCDEEPWDLNLYLPDVIYFHLVLSMYSYVVDAMSAVNKKNAVYTKTPETSK